jgi:Lrp/AsnC family transcriptional regulator, leucine-responsive regulatory protein
MDKIDHKILARLQRDADITNAALADEVNLAPSSCLRRVQRLKREGVIKKKVCVLDQKKMGRTLKAIVEIDLDRHGTEPQISFLARVKQEENITHAYSITGASDILLILTLKDMEEYEGICERLFNQERNVVRFRTSFVMGTLKG